MISTIEIPFRKVHLKITYVKQLNSTHQMSKGVERQRF
jgi:hypothetical protein